METLMTTTFLGFPIIEFIAVIFGLINVSLLNFATNKRLAYFNWYFGLVSTIIYTYLFWQWELFANSGLQVYYIITAIMGIVAWKRNNDQSDSNNLIVERMSGTGWFITLATTALLTLPLYYFFDTYTENPAPLWDSLIAALSLVAQWIMVRRYIEHWIGWVIVDIIAIPLFWSQGLKPTAILYVAFLLLSLNGLRIWWKAYNENTRVNATLNPLDRVAVTADNGHILSDAQNSLLDDPYSYKGFTPRTEVTRVERANFS